MEQLERTVNPLLLEKLREYIQHHLEIAPFFTRIVNIVQEIKEKETVTDPELLTRLKVLMFNELDMDLAFKMNHISTVGIWQTYKNRAAINFHSRFIESIEAIALQIVLGRSAEEAIYQALIKLPEENIMQLVFTIFLYFSSPNNYKATVSNYLNKVGAIDNNYIVSLPQLSDDKFSFRTAIRQLLEIARQIENIADARIFGVTWLATPTSIRFVERSGLTSRGLEVTLIHPDDIFVKKRNRVNLPPVFSPKSVQNAFFVGLRYSESAVKEFLRSGSLPTIGLISLPGKVLLEIEL